MALPDDRGNLLMLSGDTVLATGKLGVFHGVLEEMGRQFDRIDVISPKPGGPVTTRELFGNVHLHPAEGSRFGQVRHILSTAHALFAERPYRIITSHDYGTFYNGRAAAKLTRETGVPYLAEIHHVPGHPRAAGARDRFEKLLCRLYAGFAVKHAAAIRVVNKVEAPAVLKSFGVPESKIRVIPSLYLDTEVFQPGDEAKTHDIVLCGRLVPNKRFDLVIDALSRLKKMGREPRLLLVGNGPLEAELLAQADRADVRGQVDHERFLPGLEDLASAYRRSRMLICASTSEGGPRVTCEAMACGTPVVTTPVGIMTELVHDGDNGLLFRWDAAELAEKIEAILDDEAFARKLGSAGREAVLPFERLKMIQNYADEVKRLADEASP